MCSRVYPSRMVRASDSPSDCSEPPEELSAPSRPSPWLTDSRHVRLCKGPRPPPGLPDSLPHGSDECAYLASLDSESPVGLQFALLRETREGLAAVAAG